MLEELHFFIISHTLSVTQSSFALMILLINQWYLESQKPLVTLFMSKKMKERFLIKKKIAEIMLDKKRKNRCMMGKLKP